LEARVVARQSMSDVLQPEVLALAERRFPRVEEAVMPSVEEVAKPWAEAKRRASEWPSVEEVAKPSAEEVVRKLV
jgi:hypothetical protein